MWREDSKGERGRGKQEGMRRKMRRRKGEERGEAGNE